MSLPLAPAHPRPAPAAPRPYAFPRFTRHALVNGLRIVRSGLTPQDRIVLAGGQMSPPGSKVQVKPGQIEPQAAAATPAVSAPVTGEATFAR